MILPCKIGYTKDTQSKEERMKIRLNEDKELVKSLQEALKRRDGYCPCRREMIPENKCMCKEFRDQIADPTYEGYCHCMLYYKEK